MKGVHRTLQRGVGWSLLLPAVATCTAAGCFFDGRRERPWTGPREPGKRYLDRNEVQRCYIVITSDPDDCDLIGVARDTHLPVGRTPARLNIDVRHKTYSDGSRDVHIERVNESRKLLQIQKETGLLVSSWREVIVAYLFEKSGYINKRFEEVCLSAAELLDLPERTYTVRVTLEPETLDLKRTLPAADPRAGRPEYECDVRLVEVGSGRANRAATGQARAPADFRSMADRIVFTLTERLEIPPQAKVAVLDLEELGDETVSGQCGRLVSRMLSTSLINTGKFEVIERQQLDKLMQERDLTTAQIAASPGELGKVLGLDYVVLGSVAKVRYP
ncbi:MAG: CsgG/HfaB family protein [Planctomycetota bacterium]